MADEPGLSIVRLPEDQLEQLMREMRRGVAADPPRPDTPPAQATGRDAVFFREIIHDECEKLYDRFKRDQERLFKRLRMPIDDDHINETSDNLAELFELNQTIKDAKRSAWKSIGGWCLAWLTSGGAIAAIWAYLSNLGGKPH